MNEVARATTMFFSKNSNFDIDLRPVLKCELVQDIVTLNNYVKLLQSWSINKSAREIAKHF